MTTITTAEELDALPHSAIVVDSRECAWQKVAIQSDDLPDVGELWLRFGSSTAHTTRRVIDWAPFEVLSARPLQTGRKLRDVTVIGATV